MWRKALGLLGIPLLFLSGTFMQAQTTKTKRALPAIDLAAPKTFETATLALG